jgi:hypothetical protein
MLRRLRDLLPPHPVNAARITVEWRKGRIRAVRVEVGKLHLLRRILRALRF